MNRKILIAAGLALFTVLIGSPLLAIDDEDDMTPALARKVVKAMDENKTTLAAAISAAENGSKGKAVTAKCEIEDGKLNYAVFCLAGEKLMDVDVDGKTGKVTESKEVKKHEAKSEGKSEAKGDAKKTDKDEDEEVMDAATAQKMVKAMNSAKAGLITGIATAQTSCKGKAVLAHCEMEDGKLVFAVFCMAGEKLMDIDVDAKTNKVVESKEAGKHDEKHEEKHDEKGKKP